MYVSRVAAFFAAIEVVPRKFSPSASDCRGRFCFTFAGGNRKGFHRIQSRPLLRQIRFQSRRYALEKSHPKEILMKNWKGEINNDRI